MGHRKTPSLHIRFQNYETLDKIEIWANHRGEKIVPWARQALINQARYETKEEIMGKTANYSGLVAVDILRGLAGAEAYARARKHADDYVKEVEAHAAKNFR